MADIYELLDAIRERPKMYIGDGSLTNLWYLLQGYQMALHEHGDIVENGPWGFQFHVFVAKKLHTHTGGTRGYHSIILEHTGGDELQALELFFNLAEEFRAEEKNEQN